MYENHTACQDLKGQVEELLDYCIRNGHTVERMRNMLVCLLSEHETGDTTEFWRHKMVLDSQTKEKQA